MTPQLLRLSNKLSAQVAVAPGTPWLPGLQPGQTPGVLPLDEVHVWRASLEQPAFSAAYLARILAPDEQERAGRFYFESDRSAFASSRAVLRIILGRYLNLDPGQLRFRYGAAGKPALAGRSGRELCFNVSHVHGMALYAIAWQRELGIDVETLRPIPDAVRVASEFFSSTEVACLKTLPQEQQSPAFLICWTRKEAYLKATGVGLGQLPGALTIAVTPNGQPGRPDTVTDSEGTQWHIQTLYPAPGYIGALAVAGAGWCVRLWEWNDDQQEQT